ncbi:3-oxoacyl-[acyl-carrier-protein] synthase III C-terminal domain-containing protein [Streptomyces sp. NRRL S-646]|uniref:3-oxoacyl-[acyl-carrier-protein] synthase III C-terminal domain-containing protein n=1 Tax=Streptomyces sp. NRRL S-646 TaxID=1463917 RepID=UPI003B63B30C
MSVEAPCGGGGPPARAKPSVGEVGVGVHAEGPSRSVFQYDRDGHLGGAAPFLALDELEREGRIASGDLVVVATAGSGFTWGVTAIRRT